MQKDLGLTSSQYQWLLTIFYIAYIAFGFLTIMWKVVPPHRWTAGCVFSWGLVSTVQASVNSWGGMMALRCLLGVSEIAYGPGVQLSRLDDPLHGLRFHRYHSFYPFST